MDTNTILKVFVLSKPEMTQECNTTNTRASLVTTALTTTATTSCPNAKKLKDFIQSSTNKDKQSIKKSLNGDDDDDENEDPRLQAGNKRKSTMQDQTRVRSSQCRQSTSDRKSLGPIASSTCRKSTTTVGASLVKLKNLKAIRRKTRNDLKDIGHDPNINDAYHEIEEMYATRNEMRRQSSKVVAKTRGDDLE
ncbi:hypothetical protein BGX34_006377 [Mortierella sp. NVP85]|nr:hypothetical protein BGX34_006377 [Mortierella sp. NVP85]